MGRDWRRIEAELDELIPAGPHSKQVPQSPGRSTDKDSILTHIAEALQLDLALSNQIRAAALLWKGRLHGKSLQKMQIAASATCPARIWCACEGEVT